VSSQISLKKERIDMSLLVQLRPDFDQSNKKVNYLFLYYYFLFYICGSQKLYTKSSLFPSFEGLSRYSPSYLEYFTHLAEGLASPL